MNKRIVAAASCFLFILFMMIIPTSAASSFSFTWIQVPDISSTSDTHSGNGIYVDAETYLSEVCTVMSLNQEYRSVFDTVPYSFHDINLSGNRGLGILFALIGLSRRPGNTAEYCNGENISGVNIFYPEFYSAYYQQYYGAGTSYNILKNNDGYVMLYDNKQDPLMNAIISNMDSIAEYLDLIEGYTNNNYGLLQNILNAVRGSNGDTGTIYTKLNTISSYMYSVSNLVSQIVTNTNTTNTTLSAIDSYLTNQLGYMSGTLDDISYDLSVFYQEFRSFASDLMHVVNNIDDNIENIDSTLNEMMEHFNGTALEGVPVRGQSQNLWQLIKSGVGAGLNGFGQFFDVIFDALAFFGTNVNNGFDSLDDIANFQTVPYNPELLEVSITPEFTSQTVTGNGITINVSSTSVYINANGSNVGKDVNLYTPASNYPTIRSGTYQFSGSPMSNRVFLYLYNADSGSMIASLTTQESVNFTINSDTKIRILLRIWGNTSYDNTISPTLRRIG